MPLWRYLSLLHTNPSLALQLLIRYMIGVASLGDEAKRRAIAKPILMTLFTALENDGKFTSAVTPR